MTVEKVSRAMSWVVIARVVRVAAGFVANILVVRSLGRYDWGVYSILTSIMGFVVVIVMLGGGQALLKFLPTVRVAGGLRRFLSNYRKLILLQLCVWLVLFLVVRFCGDTLNRLFSERYARLGFYLQFAVGFAVFDTMMRLITDFLHSWYETRRLATVNIAGNCTYIVLLTLFLGQGFGIIGIYAAGAIVNVIMSLLLVTQVRELVSRASSEVGDVPRLGRMLRFSLPFAATGILNQIVWRQSEVIFLGAFHGPETAGYFGLAYQLPQFVLEFIPLTIWPLILAGTSEVYARGPENLPRAIDLYYRLLYILVIPVAAMGFAFSRALVPIVYGGEMLPAAQFAQLFFVVFSYSFLYTPLSMALYVIEKSWVNMLLFAILAVFNVGLDFAFIPKYGLWGAFFPVACVLILAVIVFFVAVRKLQPDIRIPVGFVVRCYIAGVPTALLAVTAQKWSSPAALAVQIPLGAVLLVIGFRLMRVIGEREKELIRKLPLPWKEQIIAIF